jgi:two-component system sensor histidine kinase/response regulator
MTVRVERLGKAHPHSSLSIQQGSFFDDQAQKRARPKPAAQILRVPSVRRLGIAPVALSRNFGAKVSFRFGRLITWVSRMGRGPGGTQCGSSFANMDSLRFLLVHSDATQSERISSVLEDAHHTVLPTPSLDEAAEALSLQRFDAVLLGASFTNGTVAAFKAKLRQVEQSQRSFSCIPILSAVAPVDGGAVLNDSLCDGYFEDPLDLNALTEVVSRLARTLARSAELQTKSMDDEFQVLAPDEFEEQVGGDRELMVEIIDLFLEERKQQVFEMREALRAVDWEALAKVAHTIKGSLGSLHAPRARSRAQELEIAARDQKSKLARQSFAALERDLEELEPALLALRAVSA